MQIFCLFKFVQLIENVYTCFFFPFSVFCFLLNYNYYSFFVCLFVFFGLEIFIRKTFNNFHHIHNNIYSIYLYYFLFCFNNSCFFLKLEIVFTSMFYMCVYVCVYKCDFKCLCVCISASFFHAFVEGDRCTSFHAFILFTFPSNFFSLIINTFTFKFQYQSLSMI